MDTPITSDRFAPEPYPIPPAPSGCTLGNFGATGDVTARKLMPGLYRLAAEGLLPEAFAVVACARRPKDHAQFRDDMRHAVQRWARHPWDARLWRTLAGRLYYHRASFDDAEGYLYVGSA